MTSQVLTLELGTMKIFVPRYIIVKPMRRMSKANESARGVRGHAPPPQKILKARCDIMHSGAFQAMIFASTKVTFGMQILSL